jgi:hypothetical protein
MHHFHAPPPEAALRTNRERKAGRPTGPLTSIRRLTHALAAAAGMTRNGDPAPNFQRPRTAQSEPVTTDGTPAPTCTSHPAAIHPNHRKPTRRPPPRPNFIPGIAPRSGPSLPFQADRQLAPNQPKAYCLRRGLRLKDGPGSARAATVRVWLRQGFTLSPSARTGPADMAPRGRVARTRQYRETTSTRTARTWRTVSTRGLAAPGPRYLWARRP